MADTFGMMEGAFFISRHELLNWINDLLKINLTKVEQLGTGAVYCQILDACFQGEVALHKVNWRARYEYEFVPNYKILQQGFDKHQINKAVEVNKLIKAKYQDNLEFGQWMKRFFELRFGQDGRKDYDALSRRGNVVPEFNFVTKGISPKCVLVQQNSLGCKRAQGENALQKKIKLSQNSSVSIKSSVSSAEKEKMKPVDLNKLIKERDDLAEKLRLIEEIIITNKENDSTLVKKVRDFLGVMNMADYSPGADESFNLIEDNSKIIEDEDLRNSVNKDLTLLIEGESI